jgi:DNA-binding transcriptional ArsR family regulator
MNVVSAPEVAHAALSPMRRQILAHLDDVASATEVAAALGLPRQKVNYHMTVLEKNGLVELSEVRQRRGFQERRFRRTGTVVVAPDILEESVPEDDLSAEAVVAAASDAIRTVGRLEATGKPHPTATMTTEVRFATPADHRVFLERVAELAAEFDRGSRDGSLAMKVTLLSHVAKGVDR